MKLPLSWLSDWIDRPQEPAVLAERLTMLGLEVESVVRVGEPVTGLVVGRVLEVTRHPDADRLSLCRVDVGTGQPVGIVCGARNVRAGGVYPTALPGVILPGGHAIKATKIRGQSSAGMLCSAQELGLDDGVDGLLELDGELAPGGDAGALLQLGDAVLELNITPNRADCFCVRGVAQEIAATGDAVARPVQAPAVAPTHTDLFPVAIAVPADCPRFIGRVIRGIDPQARTPFWMQERLRRAGVRPISPAVDVTNFVLMELGQPLHAYDLGRLRDRIEVRRGTPGEALKLLDGQTVRVDPDVLVIADGSGAIGLAGIMGGAATAVSDGTRDLFLESAFFAPAAIAGRARRFALHTDASMRFERGVDPAVQGAAIERATRLIMDIAGGEPGPLSVVEHTAVLPARPEIPLRRQRLARLLGLDIGDAVVRRILEGLRMRVVDAPGGWQVTPPSARFDLEREEDLIEEVARIHGYDQIPAAAGRGVLHPAAVGELPAPIAALAVVLMARGYQEAITYSFVSEDLNASLGAVPCPSLALSNPISADLSVMRQSLWPGLVKAATANRHRQQERVRLFETGTRFTVVANGEHREERCVSGIAFGARQPEQWGAASQPVDFFDVKSDVEAVLAAAGVLARTTFEVATHPALHPGRAACLRVDGEVAGWVGELHPALAARVGLPAAVLFEIDVARLAQPPRPAYRAPSVFPSVRRDIAVVVARELPAAALLHAVREAAPGQLRDAFVFDIYTGPQVGPHEKSVAIGLILQDTSRTLTDNDAHAVLDSVRADLNRRFQAKIRE